MGEHIRLKSAAGEIGASSLPPLCANSGADSSGATSTPATASQSAGIRLVINNLRKSSQFVSVPACSCHDAERHALLRAVRPDRAEMLSPLVPAVL